MRIAHLSIAALLLASCTTGTHTIGTIYAASKTIGPEGGTITVSAADDASIGGTSIVVPPGALSAPVKIGIYDATPLFSDPKLGRVIRIDPDMMTFSIPATARIPAHKRVTDSTKNPLVSATYGGQSSQDISGTFREGFVSFQLAQGGSFASRTSMESTEGLESISVAPTDDQVMPKGATVRLAAIGRFSDGSTRSITSEVTWESMDPTIASFQTAAGELKGNRIGSTTVLARLGNKSSPARNVIVTPKAVVSLTIEPAEVTCAVGTNKQLAVQAEYTDGTTSDVTHMVSVHSEAPDVATVDSDLLVSCVGPGTAKIVAAFGSFTGSASFTVTAAQPVVSLEINALSSASVCGDAQMMAVATYSDQSTQDVTGAVTWMSGNAGIATVDSAGVVRCLSAGAVTIGASIEGVSRSTVVTCEGATITSLSLTPSDPHLPAGASLQLTLIATYCTGATADITYDQSVFWSSSSPSVASVISSGVVSSHVEGRATITAAIEDLAASVSSALVTLSVGPHELVSLSLTRVGGSQSQPIPLGASAQFVATGTFTDGLTADLTAISSWFSTNEWVATVSSGIVRSMSQGTMQIEARYGEISATRMVVVGPAELVSITVTPGNSSVPLGTVRQMVATGIYTDGSTHDLTSSLTWTSSDQSVALVSSGLVNTVSRGTTTITASTGGVVGSTSLTVAPAEPALITVRGDTGGGCPKGMTLVLQATVTLTDGTTRTVGNINWSSSNATIASVSGGGIVTCRNQGVVRITASVLTVSGFIDVTVAPPAQVALELGPMGAALPNGTTLQLTAKLRNTDNSTTDVSSLADWSSASLSVATVSSDGIVQALSMGTVQITATYGDFTATISIQVAGPLVSLTLARADGSTSQTTPRGVPVQYVATGTLDDGSTQVFTTSADAVWSSSNPSVATVQAGRVATVSQGTTEITVQVGTVSATTTLTVGPPVFASVAIRGPVLPIHFPLGWQLTLGADAVYTDGSRIDVTEQAVWTSSDEAVITVSSDGVVVGVGIGSSEIRASFDGRTSAAYVMQVSEAVLSSLFITPNQPMVLLPNDLQLTVTGTFTDGHTEDLTTEATWTSSDESVATVSNDTAPGDPSSCTLDWGCLQSMQVGTLTITATVGLISANQTVQVQ